MAYTTIRCAAIAIVLWPLSAAAGMLEDGAESYEACALCHGLFGNTVRDKFPKLAGQPSEYLEAQIRDFLSGARSNDGGQMAAIVTELEFEDIAVVAQWFSVQDDPTPAAQSDVAGEKVFNSVGCGDCHSDSSSDDLPRLHAQHASYLAKQMRDFRDGGRAGDSDGQMQKQLLMLSDAQIISVANYLAAQPRRAVK